MQCNAMQQSCAASNRTPYGVCHDYLFKCCLSEILIAFDKNSPLRVPLSPCRSTVSLFHRIACCYWNYYRCRKELTPIVNCLTLGPAMPGQSPALFCLYVPLMGLPSVVVPGGHSHRHRRGFPVPDVTDHHSLMCRNIYFVSHDFSNGSDGVISVCSAHSFENFCGRFSATVIFSLGTCIFFNFSSAPCLLPFS